MVFIFLAYFTLYNGLQFHPSQCGDFLKNLAWFEGRGSFSNSAALTARLLCCVLERLERSTFLVLCLDSLEGKLHLTSHSTPVGWAM